MRKSKRIYAYLDCANQMAQKKYKKDWINLKQKEKQSIVKEWTNVDREYGYE